MSSGIIISEQIRWLAPAWITKSLLGDIGGAVFPTYCWEHESASITAALAATHTLQRLIDSAWEAAEPRLDIRELPASDVRTLYQAIRFSDKITRGKGARSWYEPGSYPEYVSRVAELLEMLRSDDRLADVELEPD
jgi:hypothetical protein